MKFINKSQDGNHRQQYLQHDSTPTVFQKIYNLLVFFKFIEEKKDVTVPFLRSAACYRHKRKIYCSKHLPMVAVATAFK